MLPIHLQRRYKTTNYLNLAKRVSYVLGKRRNKQKEYFYHISKKRFIPAGNTLLAGIDPILPNCCVLPSVKEENLSEIIEKATNLWSKRVGIGFDLSKADKPLKILETLSKINADIKLDHRPQRGNMAVLNINHPDIKSFINIKSIKSVYNFNLSIVIEDKDFDYVTQDFKNRKVIKYAAKKSHKTGDPGIIFLDRIRKQVPYTLNTDSNDILRPIETVVPCGEQGMHPYETCTLGSINIANPDFWSGDRLVVSELISSINTSVDILDDVLESIDYDYLGDQDITKVSTYAKRLGLGIMGWADVLNRLGISYDKIDYIEGLIHYIGQIFKDTAHQRSREIAIRDGYNYTDRYDRKHLSITCLAPTGGITLLTGNKGFSIEPYFEEANKIGWKDHLKIQSLWQYWIDNAISKTINLDRQATVDDVYQCYRESYILGCKSVTIYRDSSHLNQPIRTSKECMECAI